MTDTPHTFTIKRLVTDSNGDVPQDDSGGAKYEYTTAERGSLPTSVKGRAVLMREKEKLDMGIRGELLAWKLFTETDPQIGLNDRVEFDYVSGQSHTVKILVGSHARSADAAFYKTIGQEDTSEI